MRIAAGIAFSVCFLVGCVNQKSNVWRIESWIKDGPVIFKNGDVEYTAKCDAVVVRTAGQTETTGSDGIVIPPDGKSYQGVLGCAKIEDFVGQELEEKTDKEIGYGRRDEHGNDVAIMRSLPVLVLSLWRDQNNYTSEFFRVISIKTSRQTS